MVKNYTCIVCPMGCSVDVEIENDKIIGVKGNTCKRGEEYVKAEITNPVRTITTTVKTEDGDVLTAKQIKELQKRNAQLEEENLILKKAIAIFTPHSNND